MLSIMNGYVDIHDFCLFDGIGACSKEVAVCTSLGFDLHLVYIPIKHLKYTSVWSGMY